MARMSYSMRVIRNENHFMIEQHGSRVVSRLKDQILWVEPWGKDSIRVRATTLAEMPLRDWSLLPPKNSPVKISVEKDSARLTNGKLFATVDTKSGRARFFKTGGKEPLCEEIFTRTNYPPSRMFK